MSDNIPTFENSGQDLNSSSKIPTFLKVLCILSLVNIVFSIFPAITGVFQNPLDAQSALDDQIAQMEQIFSSIDEMPANFLNEMTTFLDAKKDNLRIENSGLILIFLLEAYGVWLMYKLKRKGYWLYVISQFGMVALNYFIYPSSNIFTTATIAMLLFSSILFISLYGMNLKHMND